MMTTDNKKFSKNAILKDKDEFKERVNYGLVAQNKFILGLKKLGIMPLNTDYEVFQEHMPKVDTPRPDYEFHNCLIEVRRQDLFDPILLGYTKKYDGWKKISSIKKKPLYFCIITKDLKNLAYVNLTANEHLIHKKENDVGDIDYCICLDVFKKHTFENGLKELSNIIKQGVKKETMLEEWFN